MSGRNNCGREILEELFKNKPKLWEEMKNNYFKGRTPHNYFKVGDERERQKQSRRTLEELSFL